MIRYAAQLVCDRCGATFSKGAFSSGHDLPRLIALAKAAGWGYSGLDRISCPQCLPEANELHRDAQDAGKRQSPHRPQNQASSR